MSMATSTCRPLVLGNCRPLLTVTPLLESAIYPVEMTEVMYSEPTSSMELPSFYVKVRGRISPDLTKALPIASNVSKRKALGDAQ